MTRMIGCALVVIGLAAAPALADVKVTSTSGGKGLGQMASGQTITFIKGHKMRTETQLGDRTVVSIIDLDAQKMITLDPRKKEAESYDLTKMRAEMEKSVGTAQAKMSFTPNGQKKTLLGRTCDGYDLMVSMPAGQPGMEMTMTMSGPIWVAKGMPGFADWAGFYGAAAEKGMLFNSPQQAKAQPSHAKGFAEMYRALSGTGLPLEQEIAFKMEGGGPMAGLMAKMGNMSMSVTVTAVSTDGLADDLFSIPADYKVKNR